MNETSDGFDKKTLKTELLVIGINIFNLHQINYLNYSLAYEEKIKELYQDANAHLIEFINSRKTGKFIHITGEMKALADPSHRNCVKELYEHNKQQFEIMFSLPDAYSLNGSDVKRYNIAEWKDANWIDHLDSFDILGANKVKLFNKYERESIHYSLFGSEIIIFQSRHIPREQKKKKVWLLQSEPLFKKLEKHAKGVFEKSTYIGPRTFFQFNLSLSSNISLHLLFSLQNNGPAQKDEFVRQLKMLEIYDKSIIENLKIIGFIQDIDNSYQISNYGKYFLKLFG